MDDTQNEGHKNLVNKNRDLDITLGMKIFLPMNYVILEFKQLQKQSRLVFHSIKQGNGIKDFLNCIELDSIKD